MLKTDELEDLSGERAVARLEGELARLQRVREAIGKVVYGQDEAIDQLLVCLLSGGHALLEGAPGLGKTLLVKALGTVCGLEQSRIQFTPDLMPADITGTVVLHRDELGNSRASFEPGPIFAQMVLTDEINRGTPKTQSALLEAMQEGTVTVAGKAHALPSPFYVIATQNPIEMEGTYVLPEAQVDRFFFKIDIPYPDADMLGRVLEMTEFRGPIRSEAILDPESLLELQRLVRSVPVSSLVRSAVVDFLLTTQPKGDEAPERVRRFVSFGVSPRGGQALMLAGRANALLRGRYNVSFNDLREVLLPALRHRFELNYEGEAEGMDSEEMLRGLFEEAVDRASK